MYPKIRRVRRLDPNRTRATARTILLATLCAGAISAHAGGLWIYEYGTPVMGRAAAGAEAGVDDASAGFHNPASMTRLDSTQFMATGGAIYTRSEFDVESSSVLNGTGDGGDAGGLAPGGAVYYVRPLSERWRLGLNVVGLTGASLDYDDDWVGRYQATEVNLLLLATAVSVGYRVSDRLSLGASAQVGYSELEQKLAIPNPLTGIDGRAKLDGDDFEFAYSLSALYAFKPGTRLGVVYQSEYEPNYDGGLAVEPLGLDLGVSTVLPLAQTVRVGFSHEFDERLSLHATVAWEDWSTLDAVLLNGEAGGRAALDRNWEDTWHYAGGVRYRLSDAWTLQSGIAYDTNPVDAQDRTADLAVDRQVRYAFGAVHTRPSGLEIGGHLVYADYGSARIDSSRAGNTTFSGEYSTNDILFASVSFNWNL